MVIDGNSYTLYSFAEIEKHFNIKVRTLRHLYTTGKITTVKIGNRHYMTQQMIQDYISSNTKDINATV